MNYATEQIVGGAGRLVGKTERFIESLITDEKLEVRDIPLGSRFFRSIPEERLFVDSPESDYLDSLNTEEARDSFNFKQMAEHTYQELKKLSYEEAFTRFGKLKTENPNLAKKVLQVREEEELGLDSIDRKIKDLGVTDGMRAQYLYRKLKKLETIEERKEAWKELVRKKLITDTVGTQIKFLIKREATQ